MTDETSGGGLHIDSDWKAEAAREKELLIQQEEQERAKAAQSGGESDPQSAMFVELINMLAMQAAIGLGGYEGPGGERIPPNPIAAKHHIDLLEILQSKTEGNLTEEETQALNGVLHELRMHYVQAVNAPVPPDEPKSKA